MEFVLQTYGIVVMHLNDTLLYCLCCAALGCFLWQHLLCVSRSKAAHRVSTLLQEHFGLADVTVDSPRLFASLLPPDDKKVEALR